MSRSYQCFTDCTIGMTIDKPSIDNDVRIKMTFSDVSHCFYLHLKTFTWLLLMEFVQSKWSMDLKIVILD